MLIDTKIIGKEADINNEIHPLLKARWSPRTFASREISETVLQQLFEAARWAASSYNRQPWRFIYATKGSEAYDKMLACLSDFNQQWACNAPLLLLTAYKEKTESGEDNFHALHDLGLSMGNMSMQAQHLGIALHQMAGVDWKKAQKVFEVPEGFHLATAVAIGYYGGDLTTLPEPLQQKEMEPRTRHKIEEFAFLNSWK